VVRIWVWSAGLSYLASLALLAWFLADGGAVRANADCRAHDLEVAVYWTCPEASFGVQFLANLVNAVLTGTLWAPVFVAAALPEPELRPAAALLVFGNLVGFSAAILVTFRTLRSAWRRVRG
jgi:hypothetical protein